MPEEWRTVPGWSEYEVSNEGRVRSSRRWNKGHRPPRILKPWPVRGGYPMVKLCSDSGDRMAYVHVLVRTAFQIKSPSQTEAGLSRLVTHTRLFRPNAQRESIRLSLRDVQTQHVLPFPIIARAC